MTNSQSNALTTLEEFAAYGLINPEAKKQLQPVFDQYAATIPLSLAQAVKEDKPDGPLARQFVPSEMELIRNPAEREDPIGDKTHSPVKGIVHRYPDRVLLMPISVCAVYCRFCFRREQVGPSAGLLSASELEAALNYVRTDTDIWEVIITGGDPFVLSPKRIKGILKALDTIKHVSVVRFHTRVPVAKPEQITLELLEVLESCSKSIFVAIHCNHATELTENAAAACALLADKGIPLLGQSVLLNGVNDDSRVLSDLFRKMVKYRIKPYYLHHPDLAPGTAHFRVTIEKGRNLMKKLRGQLSGLCQPTYIFDIPGGHGKVPIGPDYVTRKEEAGENDAYTILDINGVSHTYPMS